MRKNLIPKNMAQKVGKGKMIRHFCKRLKFSSAKISNKWYKYSKETEALNQLEAGLIIWKKEATKDY